MEKLCNGKQLTDSCADTMFTAYGIQLSPSLHCVDCQVLEETVKCASSPHRMTFLAR